MSTVFNIIITIYNVDNREINHDQDNTMEYVSNWVTNKVAGYAKTGIEAGGTLAGNAVGGVGTLVENSGRSVGQSANGVSPMRTHSLTCF